MLDSMDLICDKCDFRLKDFSSGYPYVILDSGERFPLAAPHIDTEAEAATGISYDRLIAEKRLGCDRHYVCLACAKDFIADPEKHEVTCPDCARTNFDEAYNLHEQSCPKCKDGQLRIENFCWM